MNAQPISWYLTRMIRYAPVICGIHALLWAVSNASALIPGVLISRLVTSLENGDDNRAMTMAIAFGGLAIGQALLYLLAGRTELAMRFRMSGLVRRNLLRLLLVTPGKVALSRSVGDTISRFRDDAYLAEDALDWTDEIIARIAIALGALGVMLWIDPIMTLVTVVPTLAIIAGARLAGQMLGDLRRTSSEATGRFTSTIGDVIGSALTIQAAGASERTVAHIAGLARSRRSAVLKDRVVTQGVEGVTRNASAIGTGLVMLMAATRLRGGDLSVADFILFISWFAIVADVAIDLGNYLAQMAAARVAFDRMETVAQGSPAEMSIVDHTPLYLNGPMPEMDVPAEPAMPQVGGEIRLCHAGTTFALPSGGVTVITGRIGAGKTSLLQSILGLDPSGVSELHTDDTAIGYVPQVPRLFSGTIRENILLGRKQFAGNLDEVVKLAALHHDLRQMPQGLETVVGARGLRVSGGQGQRIALARALVSGPTLLVVDDLSSALDVSTEKSVWQGLGSLPNLTIIAISHRRFVIQQADLVVVMKSGRVEQMGSLEEVLASSAEMRDLWAHPEGED